ncbi:MAG TPA: ABC transporter permease [Acidimicrobiales bacterium]|nr:ABC transporter permease [Acidimicrobiales bacterium]
MTDQAADPTVAGPGATRRAVAHHGLGGTANPFAVGNQIALRGIRNTARIPAALVPTVAMPMFFVIAFSGAFSSITELDGFPTDSILSWMAPFAILQGASFAGMGTAFSTARDIEGGFYDRLLLAPTRRWSLVLGPMIFAGTRAVLPLVVVLPVALLAGMDAPAGALAVLPLLVACIGVGTVAGLWGLGVAYRFQSQRAGAIVQLGIFTAMFLSIGQAPIEVMEGWLKAVASVNPVTNVIRLGRQGFIGDITWADTWPGLLALVVSAALLAVFCARQFRRLFP